MGIRPYGREVFKTGTHECLYKINAASRLIYSIIIHGQFIERMFDSNLCFYSIEKPVFTDLIHRFYETDQRIDQLDFQQWIK